jgi:DNA-binding CsgD family transcriptional regulator
MQQAENKQLAPEIERLALQRAIYRAAAERWTLSVAVFLFAIVVIINIVLYSVGNTIFAGSIALLGLSTVWLMGWRRGNMLRQRFYSEELTNLQQKPSETASETTLQLTPRETEVLRYLAQGFSNKKIASELGISEYTVKNHITGVLEKLNATDRTEAVVIAIRHGLIALPPPRS